MSLSGYYKLAFEEQIDRIENKCGIFEENYNISNPKIGLSEASRRFKDIIECFQTEKFLQKELNKSPETVLWAMRLSVVRCGTLVGVLFLVIYFCPAYCLQADFNVIYKKAS